MKNIGFSLIEMLIVVAIILIITAITIPNYSRQIETSRRTEAKTSLLDYAMRFEDYYSENYSYTSADTYYGLNANPSTENGYYQLSATISDGGTGYTITATATGAQTSDTTCSAIIINNLGQKTPSSCW